jgi:hypothetical protein
MNKQDYHKWRDMPEISVEVLEDFLFWLEEEDSQVPLEEVVIKQIKSKIDQFLGKENMDEIKSVEQELLMDWTKQVKEY